MIFNNERVRCGDPARWLSSPGREGHRLRVSGAVAVLTLIWVLPCDAVQSYTLTFDDHGEQAGQVIDDEYQSLYGITISADGVSSGSPDVAAIYDSSPTGFGSSGSLGAIGVTQLDPIPEPSRAMLLATGVAAGLLVRRRFRSRHG